MSPRPRNLLILLSDEHEARHMGCADHALARTPNLDALAARGTRFTHAWTPSPICVPARASLATGRWVHDHGCWDNALAYDGSVRSWGHRLQAAGRRVDSIGKLHYRNGTDPTGFDRQVEPMHIVDGVGQVWGSVRDPLPETMGPSPLLRRIGPGQSEYNDYDLRVTAAAVDWLGHAPREPWTLFVGLVAPHFPLVVPARYMDHLDIRSLPLPKLLPRDGHVRHPWVERMVRFSDHDAGLADDHARRLALACYLGLVAFMDEQVGRILAALTASGQADDTYIVYSSDHGDNAGTRGTWNKSLMYRESTGVPLIVAGPDIPAGRVCATQANLVDIFPTVLDAAALPAEPDLPGRSLLAMARDDDDPARWGFSEYHAVGSPSAAYMLARGQFKYHHYVGYPPELFDLAADPEEVRNLADHPAFAATCADFAAELRRRLDPDATDRRAKDAQNAFVAARGGRAAALKQGPMGATPAPVAAE
jgi:choline-sulfatase